MPSHEITVEINPTVVTVASPGPPGAPGTPWPGVYDITAYGAEVDGTTDDTAAVTAALAAAYAAGGGTVYFPAGVTRINSQITIPNDGGGVPKQPPIKLLGAGSRWDGRWQAGGNPPGASILDLRSTATPAKIDTRGVGQLQLRDLVVTDLGTSSNAFLQTTNTTLLVENCSFYGNPTKSQTTCDQDAIVLGGTTTTIDGSATAAFQGYGTIIAGNYFSSIRRGVQFRTYANGIIVRENTWSSSCGAADGTAAAIEFTPSGAEYCVGNIVSGNLIECSGYTYVIRATQTTTTSFLSNNLYDTDEGVQAYYRFETNGKFNYILDGHSTDTTTFVSEDASVAGMNTIITAHQSKESTFPQPVNFSNLGSGARWQGVARFEGGNSQTIIQPATNQPDFAAHLIGLRSALDDVNPGGTSWYISQDGYFNSYNSAGAGWNYGPGRVTAENAGGNFLIYTGYGGSYIHLSAYATVFKHYSTDDEMARIRISPHDSTKGAVQLSGTTGPLWTHGAGDPENVVTAPQGSLFTRTDGGTSTTLYVKTSGAGNTGWTAK